MADAYLDVEGLLVAVGALKPNDQRLSKKEYENPDLHHGSIRSGKMLTTSAGDDDAGDDDADDWD